MKLSSPKTRRAGFSLVELLTVITIIALLFGLVVGGFTYADRKAKRDATEVRLRALVSALEKYKTEFGDYPQPKNPSAMADIGNKSYTAGGAACLYQALSGDGTDQIDGATPAGEPASNGDIEDAEVPNIIMKDMPKEMYANFSSMYMFIDGFGRPFQYTRAIQVNPNAQGGAGGGNNQQPVTINNTFDLWSYGEDEDNLTIRSYEASQSPTTRQAMSRWIKNW